LAAISLLQILGSITYQQTVNLLPWVINT